MEVKIIVEVGGDVEELSIEDEMSIKLLDDVLERVIRDTPTLKGKSRASALLELVNNHLHAFVRQHAKLW